MTDPLIRTKLCQPYTRPELVPRPRFQRQIGEGLRGPLTLITAPAGFGKTTLIVSSVANYEHPIAWLSLDKDDNREGRFLKYVIAALQAVEPTIGNEAAQFMTASHQVPSEAVVTSLANDLDTFGGEITLVLDDYHIISSQAVHAAVAFLLEYCPTTFHLVIVSRSDPPLPLGRLRARGQMVELRAADLSFTEPEAAQFLNDLMGLHLDAASIAVLEARTEGWIAGLQMAALSMRDREDVRGFIEDFSGTNRHVLDYLLEEVLTREPEAVQAFLLQTAVLTRLTGPLCDAVTGASDSQVILESLERRNLFVVPLDDERIWYRYHHLFADLLQARLYQSGPERVRQLLSRAAEWCAHSGQIVEAVDYAFAAQDFERAAGLIERYWDQAAGEGEIETVWSWLCALPENTIRNSAPLSVTYCWLIWFQGRTGEVEAHLLDAERVVHDMGVTGVNEETHAGLHAELAALRSIVARYHNDFETAVTLAERALDLIPQKLLPQASAQLHGLVFMVLASGCDGAGDLDKAARAYAEAIRWNQVGTNAAGVTGITYRLVGSLRLLGRLRAAYAACREALEYVQAQGMTRLPATGILHIAMSEVLVERNELEAAEAHLARGIELGKGSGRLDAVKNAAYALSRLRQARQDTHGALAAIQEAEAALGERPYPLAKAELLAFKTRILVRQGSLNEAAQCAWEAVQLVGEDRGQTGQIVALAVSRVLAAQCRPAEAIDHLTSSLVDAERGGRWGVVIELLVLRALALARRGDTREAVADLERALALAEPEGYSRVFLDEGPPMQMLLTQWLARAGTNPLRDFARQLLSEFEAEVTAAQEKNSPNDNLVDPLSERELEVLHIMALGKTNEEIAEQLVIARGTVKAHTASIYRKLDVANRTEAVARARALGILP